MEDELCNNDYAGEVIRENGRRAGEKRWRKEDSDILWMVLREYGDFK